MLNRGGRAEQTLKTDRPHLGIFWLVPGDPGVRVLLVDQTALETAEPYGDFLTHPRSHYDVWEAWKGLNSPDQKRLGIPAAVGSGEYEAFPRGRIVFFTPNNVFWIYADRRLQAPELIQEIRSAFGLETAKCLVKSDAHYS